MGEVGGDDILVSEADGARRGFAVGEDKALGVALEGAAGENEVCEVLVGGAWDGERGQGGEEEGLETGTCDVVADVQSGEDGGALRGVGVLGVGVGEDDKSGEDEVAREQVVLDDGADVVEGGGVVVWV